MNKLLQTTLITAVLSTGAMAVTIGGNISIENTLNINKEALVHGTLDFTPGGHGYIADGVELFNNGTIKLGKPEKTPEADLATINVTREITTEPAEEGEEPTTITYYQYRYISTDGAVKYVWSSNENATSSDTDFVEDIDDTTTTSAISDYDSGFGLVKAIAGGNITGGEIKSRTGHPIDINTDAKYEVMAGYALNKDERVLEFGEEKQEKTFFGKYTGENRRILEKDNSGGLFTPDIANPEVISTITAGSNNLGGESRNGLDPQKLSSQTEVKDYLSEWGVTMHKGTQDIAYEETESNTIIEQLAKTTSSQAVAIPDELGKGNGEITIVMPGWGNGESQKPDYVEGMTVKIKGNLHNIGYENETLNFEKAGDGVDEYVAHTIAFSGDNRYLKGTVNINVDPEFQGENSIPGGVTNCYGNSIEAQILDPKTNIIIDTAAVIVPENATLNILGETAMIMGNLVVKGVMNIGAPAATE